MRDGLLRRRWRSGTRVPCTAVNHCTSSLTCTSGTNSQCTSCDSDRYLNNGVQDTCSPCTPVVGCNSPLTCTTAANSQCTACDAGRYLAAGSPSTCPACTPVDGCVQPVTCIGATPSQCRGCAFGRYLVGGPADACPACPAISGCTAPVSCTNPGDSQCNTSTTTTTTAVTTTTGGETTTTTTLPAELDDYNCYKAKDLKNPRFVRQTGVEIVDQFATRTIDVKKPYFLCAPASRDGSTVADPSTHLCCYKTKATKLDVPVTSETADDFGTLQVQVKTSSLVCQPCSKELLP